MQASPNVLVINGSARHDSNTLLAVKKLSPFSEYDIVSLHEYNLQYYAYDQDPCEDFLKIVQKMIEANEIIFATPVYWYAMSGRMKNFFDMFTKLITVHKDLGRNLKDKNVYLIAQGSDEEIPNGFSVPFERTSSYFEMSFISCHYLSVKS